MNQTQYVFSIPSRTDPIAAAQTVKENLEALLASFLDHTNQALGTEHFVEAATTNKQHAWSVINNVHQVTRELAKIQHVFYGLYTPGFQLGVFGDLSKKDGF